MIVSVYRHVLTQTDCSKAASVDSMFVSWMLQAAVTHGHVCLSKHEQESLKILGSGSFYCFVPMVFP